MYNEKRKVFLASSLGEGAAATLLWRIKAGESVTAAERLGAIKTLMATSPRDWSADNELWTLWQLACYETSDFETAE